MADDIVAVDSPEVTNQFSLVDSATYTINMANFGIVAGNGGAGQFISYPVPFNNTGCTSIRVDIGAGTDTTDLRPFYGGPAGIYTTGVSGTSNIFYAAAASTITVGHNSIVYGFPLTPEQQAEMAAQQAAWVKANDDQQRKHRLAEAKATKLLRSTVGRRQYELYKQRGFFEIVGQTGKRYRFRPQRRVQIMAENFGDKVDYELCIVHANEYVPPTDTLITLMLLVLSGEAGEKVMHEKGNRRAA